jgi:hypothetical protein
MVNLKPTLLKTILTLIIFAGFLYNFIKITLNKDSICKVLCTYPNCPACAYPTSTTEIILWGVLTFLVPMLFYLIYSIFQKKR